MKDLEGTHCVDGRPEHQLKLIDSRDGVSTFECTRCGAEAWEDDED